VYVSLYGPDGNLAGQAGSHVAVGPLEESIRKFSLEAVKQAQPALSKANFANYVVDISIPYGFANVGRPEELVPMLNGVIVHQRLKTSAFHPDAWRKFPDPHQLLASICVGLGLKPWAYATGIAKLESFRILSFNEKEPFQDLGAATRKKKKKKSGSEGSEDAPADDTGGGGGGDNGSPFSF
jgi:AMMECR1 domain-containing protein